MRAGKLGIPDYDFEPIESFSEVMPVDESQELTACLEVRRTDEVNGVVFQEGRAAIQEFTSQDRVEIDTESDSISVSENTNIVETNYTEFVLVPGAFVAVDSSSGTFAFNLISNQTDAATISPATIDLNGFANSYNGQSGKGTATPWQVGFYGNSGQTEKGTVYGDDIFDDSTIGTLAQRLPKNQLGLDMQLENENIRITVTESGYVEIYQPSNYDSKEFTEFILEHLLEHTDQKT